ncbi:DNA-binding transcriptional regulator, Lrp family [Enterobacter sp. NFR05]|jgi:DNA-binding Lrp family transcriptional regulator|nr:DNA-binding transcriptional regulator, Lrp family [Enterobacter sp. NFR05]
MMTLDAWDKKILTLLQRNNRLSQREIADLVNLSASAVNRRIAALEEAGVVKANVSIVDASKVGRPITIMVQVMVANERLDLLEEDRQRFVNCPQVQQVYYVTGDFDFLLVINVRDMAEYEMLTRELFFVSGNIKSFKTIVSMQNAKQEMTVLIE